MKQIRLFQWLFLLILIFAVLFPSNLFASNPPKSGPITNVAFMEKTASSAVDSLIREMPFPLTGAMRLRTATPHDASWMIESLFGGKLRDRGVEVMVSEAAPNVTPDTSLAKDTTRVVQAPAIALPPQGETAGLTLEYRITELGMTYPRAWRPHLIGRKVVERVGVASLYGRLIDEKSGKLVWVGEGSASRRDVVQASRLSFLEGSSQEWQKGTVPAGKVGAYVEPLVVAAIVAGLVYLFYSNKE